MIIDRQRRCAVQSRPGAEQMPVAHLNRQGGGACFLRDRKWRRHARRAEMVLAPFFPRYLVAAIDISTPRRRSIYSTVGVSRIVCNGETPAPVYRQIDASPEARENERGFARLKQRSNFSVGDQARVVDGVLAGNLGLCAGMKDAERLPFF